MTMLNETEGKAYQHDRAVSAIFDSIDKLPKPPQQPSIERSQAFLYLSIANSTAASLSGSAVDGIIPQRPQSLLTAGSQSSDPNTVDEQAHERQEMFRRLRDHLIHLTSILDEKNMVLSAANDTLSRQVARLESSFPYIENEVSEEARLGSNTHWALPHMKEMRRANGGVTERPKRDIQAANNLAAAAAQFHERDIAIAATRSEARREAMLAKRNRAPHNLDSDVEDRTVLRKAAVTGKVRKAAENLTDARASAVGSGGPSHKKRRVEKATVVPGERAMGAALNGRLGTGRASPRDTPLLEASKKKNKPLPANVAPKKK